jgi:hypothetical protein
MSSLYFARLETWALRVISQVEAGSKVEDARVELKREWIDPIKSARRLPGHANAAMGADVLWIVGLDEVAGVTGAKPNELANWWTSVQAQFDGVTPALTDLTIHKDGLTLAALFFRDNTRSICRQESAVWNRSRRSYRAGGTVARWN